MALLGFSIHHKTNRNAIPLVSARSFREPRPRRGTQTKDGAARTTTATTCPSPSSAASGSRPQSTCSKVGWESVLVPGPSCGVYRFIVI